ncbi:uncharacterized protein LOC127733725 [Mytilus californianus]|uniref:uncharacterized protein LOC127733725 n=1 Tax=Mytilus californianus TaxID=6549 RepID=UPI002245C5E2|nr:uncharacterized protein LOC127733725 [Mytilus californianus]
MFIVIVISLGFICGNFVYKLVLGKLRGVDIKHFKRHNIHDPRESRPGLSIKKDLSIQFSDYLPRNIFITTGNWYRQRESIKLFLQTYPDAAMYHLYSFLEEDSHKPFFVAFDKINIVQSKILSDSNETISKHISRFGSESIRKNLSSIDFGAWLIDTFHQDDYVIVRMESENETAIARRLGKIGALDWIDKYYTTSSENDTLSVYHEVFRKMNIPLFIWNDDENTYSDFDELNGHKGPPRPTNIILDCGYYENFLFVMYVPLVSKQAIYAVEVLKAFSGPRFLQTSLFLSRNFIVNQRDLTESLVHSINIGLYMANKTNVGNTYAYHQMRNELVEVSKVLQQFETNPVEIQYVNTIGFEKESESKLCNERVVDIFKEFLNIDYLLPQFIQDNSIKVENITRKHGQIFALDLTAENSEMMMIYILKKYGGRMVGINTC